MYDDSLMSRASAYDDELDEPSKGYYLCPTIKGIKTYEIGRATDTPATTKTQAMRGNKRMFSKGTKLSVPAQTGKDVD